MRLTDIDRVVVFEAITGLADRFHTTDVSQHPAVRERHQHLRNERNYNAVFGSFLSRLAHEPDAPIRFLSPGNGDAWWEKTSAASPLGASESVPRTDMPSEPTRMVSVMTKVDRDTYDQLRLIAFVRGQALARLMRLALENLVKDVSIPDDLMRQIREAAGGANADMYAEGQDEE